MADPHHPENGVYTDVMVGELTNMISGLRKSWDYKLITEESGFCDICPSDLSTARLIPPNSLTGHLRRCRKCVERRAEKKIVLLALKRPGPGRKWLSAREFRQIIFDGDEYPLRDEWIARIFKRNPRTRNPGTESDIDESEKDNEDKDDASDNEELVVPDTPGHKGPNQEQPISSKPMRKKRRHEDDSKGDTEPYLLPKQRRRLKKGATTPTDDLGQAPTFPADTVLPLGTRPDQIGKIETTNIDQPLNSTPLDGAKHYSTPPSTTGSSYILHGPHGSSSSTGTPNSPVRTSASPNVQALSDVSEESLRERQPSTYHKYPELTSGQIPEIHIQVPSSIAPTLQSVYHTNWNPQMFAGYQSLPLPPPMDMSTEPSFAPRPSYPRSQSDLPVQKVDWSPQFQASMADVQQRARDEIISNIMKPTPQLSTKPVVHRESHPRALQPLGRSRTEPQLDLYGPGGYNQPPPPSNSSTSLNPINRQHSVTPMAPGYSRAPSNPLHSRTHSMNNPQSSTSGTYRGFINPLQSCAEVESEHLGAESMRRQAPSTNAGSTVFRMTPVMMPVHRPSSPRQEFFSSFENTYPGGSQVFSNSDASNAPPTHSYYIKQASGSSSGSNQYSPATSDIPGFLSAQGDRASRSRGSSGLGMNMADSYRTWAEGQLRAGLSVEGHSTAESVGDGTSTGDSPDHFTPGAPCSFDGSPLGFDWNSFKPTGACDNDLTFFPDVHPGYNASQQAPIPEGAYGANGGGAVWFNDVSGATPKEQGRPGSVGRQAYGGQ